MVVKTMDAAIRDGDKIYATVSEESPKCMTRPWC